MYRDRGEIHQAGNFFLRGEHATKDFARVRDLIQPDESIHLGQLAGQLIAIALRETAADHQLLTGLPACFKDRFDGFPLGGLNETAGVYDDYVGLVGIGSDLKAPRHSVAQHYFCINEILSAAETNHADLGRPDFTGNRGHQTGYRNAIAVVQIGTDQERRLRVGWHGPADGTLGDRSLASLRSPSQSNRKGALASQISRKDDFAGQ